MAWRHHDLDISDSVSEDGFRGMATTWDFPGFHPVFKDTEGNVVTMSEYLRFLFLSEATIEKESVVTNQDLRVRHSVPPLSAGQAILDKTHHQKEVEIADPKIVATHEKKPVLPPRKGRRKSRAPTRERVLIADPASPNMENPFGGAANIDESQGDQSLDASHRAHGDECGSSRDHSYYVSVWFIYQRCRVDNPIWCRELMIHLAPPAAQEESNALDNSTALERLSLLWDGEPWLKQTCLKGSRISRLIIIALLRHMQTALKIKELEDTLARKDSALVYAERINPERAPEKERLVTRLSKSEMEKFDCIRKLLPAVVERLFQSHEYKQSLLEPFNLAI
nr:hypothetical protein [Tanacetum cinerariifolium]